MSRLPSEEAAVAHEIYERLGGFIPGCVVTMEAATEAARAVLALLNERAAASPTPEAAATTPPALGKCGPTCDDRHYVEVPSYPEAAPVVSGSVCGTCSGSGKCSGCGDCHGACHHCGGTGKAGGR